MTTWQRLQPVLSSTHRLDALRGVSARTVTDAGFTLIELMVVLLILAILLAIAIPTFLGATKSANDRAAQSNLNTAMLNAKAAFQANGQSYGAPNTVNSTVLKSAEPGLSFTTGASTGQGTISVFPTSDGNAIVLAAFSKSKNCWYQIDNPSGATAVTTTPTGNPYASATVTGTNGAVATPTAGAALVFSATTAGTIYAEVKGDSNSADCSALAPVYNGSSYEWSTTGFPSL